MANVASDLSEIVAELVPTSRRLANDRVWQLLHVTFLRPDQHSRTKDLEGRRLVEVDGGWQIVSYAKWRHKMSAEERRDYKRQHESARRERLRAASKQSTAAAVDRLQGRARGSVVDK